MFFEHSDKMHMEAMRLLEERLAAEGRHVGGQRGTRSRSRGRGLLATREKQRQALVGLVGVHTWHPPPAWAASGDSS